MTRGGVARGLKGKMTDAASGTPGSASTASSGVMSQTCWSASPFCGPRLDADLLGFGLPSAILEDQEG